MGESWVAYNWASRLGERYDTTLLTYHKRDRPLATPQLPGLRVVEWRDPPLVGRYERLNSMMKPGYVPFYGKARRWVRHAIAGGEHFDLAFQPVPVAMRYPSPMTGLGIPYVFGPVGGGLSSPPAFGGDEDTSPWFVRLRALDGWRLHHDWLLRRTYEEAACVLGIGEYVRTQLGDIEMQAFRVMSETGLSEIPPPVDRSERTGPVRLLYVGRLVRTKGARDAIRALSLVRDLEVMFDIVGDGPDRGACESEARELGLGERVVFHGAQPRSAVSERYRAADVFVFPSYQEPGGNVVPEAMSFGLPVVVCNRGGPGLATTDDCAIRLAVESPEVLSEGIADAIRTLVNDSALRRRMGMMARKRAQTSLMWDSKVDELSQIFEHVLASAR